MAQTKTKSARSHLLHGLRWLWLLIKWSLIIVVVLLVTLSIVVNLPAVQQYAARKTADWFSETTGGQLEIGGFDLRLPYYLSLENVSLADPDKRELAKLQHLEIQLGWRQLWRNKITFDYLKIDGLNANIYSNTSGEWNYDFILEAFASDEDSAPPDSSATPWDFAILDLRMEQINLRYYDGVALDSLAIALGALEVDVNRMSILEGTYDINHIHLDHSDLIFRMGAESKDDSVAPDAENAEDAALPYIALKELIITEQNFDFQYLEDNSRYKAYWSHLSVRPEVIAPQNMQFALSAFALDSLEASVSIAASPASDTPFDGEVFSPVFLDAKNISISNSSFYVSEFDSLEKTKTLSEVQNLSLSIPVLETSPDHYVLELEGASIQYDNLPKLHHLSATLALNRETLLLEVPRLDIGESSARTKASLHYDDLADLVNELRMKQIDFELEQLLLTPADMAGFWAFAQPDSAPPPLPKSAIEAKAAVKGTYKSLDIKTIELRSGGSLLRLSGKSAGNKLAEHNWQIQSLLLDLLPSDFSNFLPDSLDETYIPDRIKFKGRFAVEPYFSQLSGELVAAPIGSVDVEAESAGWKSDQYDLKSRISSKYVDLSRFTGADTASLAFDFGAELQHLGTDSMSGTVTLYVPDFRQDDIRLNDMNIVDTIRGSRHEFTMSIRDSAAVADIEATVSLTPNIEAQVSADLGGIDFQYIGVTNQDYRLQSSFKARYVQNDSLQEGDLEIGPSIIVRNNERSDVAPAEAHFHLSPDSTGVQFQSELLKLQSTSNLSLSLLESGLREMLSGTRTSELPQDGYWNLDFDSADPALLSEILLPELTRFDPAQARIRYRAGNHSMEADVALPHVAYAGLIMDSLAITLTTKNSETYGAFGIKQLAYDSLRIDHIRLNMEPQSGGTRCALTIGDTSDSPPYQIAVNLKYLLDSENRSWLIEPEPILFLSGKEWKVEPTAMIRITQMGTALEGLSIQRNQQRLQLSKSDIEETLHFTAQRFKLNSLSEVFTKEDALFGGVLNAGLHVNSDGTFEGDGLIEDFALSGADFGNFSFAGKAKDKGLYQLNIDFSEGVVDASATGKLDSREPARLALDLDIALDAFDVNSLPKLVPSLLTRAEGTVSGNLKLTGNSDEPILNGAFKFANVQLGLKGSAQNYRLSNEHIRLEPQALVFPSFAIRDSTGQKLVVDGRIAHKNFDNFSYDLSIKSDKFTLIDIRPEEYELFYGKLIVGSDIRITGTEALPVVRSNISLKEGSELVFSVPESNYNSFSSDGLVEWVQFDERPAETLITKEKQERAPSTSFETIIDLSGNLNIDKETRFRVLIDPLAGDYLEIAGGGKLALGYDRAGRVNLSGTYTVSGGSYQMTFYNIVKRKFELEPGSRITWNGDPFSADLSLTALYPTRASALGLMTSQNAAVASEGLRRMLDWEVMMNINGELESPEIGFDLRLAKSGPGSVSGAIDSRLIQLRENESELNKQVFALIIFNSFISEGGSGTTTGDVVANQARSSASQMLTQQLNNISDKLVDGVDITFDLQSYGSEGNAETDLSVDVSKSLLDDRLIVRVGSTVALEQSDPMADNAQQLMTNFIMEYKLTEDGRYRLKAFRKTDVEDILVGRITRTGAGFLFRRNFDRGNQVFKTDPAIDGNPNDDASKKAEDSEPLPDPGDATEGVKEKKKKAKDKAKDQAGGEGSTPLINGTKAIDED